MQEFIEIPASKKSLAKRKLIHGIGVNDAWYTVKPTVNGSRLQCPYYAVWKGMLGRAYSDNTHTRQPTYIGCSVAKEWLTFSNFRSWMETQDWEEKQLDKDILIPENKEYGPNACIFVSRDINNLLNDNAASRGDYPQGVCFRLSSKRCSAQCMVNGKTEHLGTFNSIKEAECAYLTFKSVLVVSIAYEAEAVSAPKLQEALLRHADLFKSRAERVCAEIKRKRSLRDW